MGLYQSVHSHLTACNQHFLSLNYRLYPTLILRVSESRIKMTYQLEEVLTVVYQKIIMKGSSIDSTAVFEALFQREWKCEKLPTLDRQLEFATLLRSHFEEAYLALYQLIDIRTGYIFLTTDETNQ